MCDVYLSFYIYAMWTLHEFIIPMSKKVDDADVESCEDFSVDVMAAAAAATAAAAAIVVANNKVEETIAIDSLPHHRHWTSPCHPHLHWCVIVSIAATAKERHRGPIVFTHCIILLVDSRAAAAVVVVIIVALLYDIQWRRRPNSIQRVLWWTKGYGTGGVKVPKEGHGTLVLNVFLWQ